VNPFRFGDLALDDSFTDRDVELAELEADMRNGQNIVVMAPRRYGKSSLVWRAAQRLTADGILVAQVDLMRASTKEQLASLLSRAIHEEIATPIYRARDRAAQIFRSLRITPTITVDPMDGSLGFSFAAGYDHERIDATIERLLELPAELAAERGRRVALVFDEFQEILELDSRLPALMRAVFQAQPDVAHVYLGSRRSMMRRLFNDANEPFWRSARQMELGRIEPAAFAPFIERKFAESGKAIDPAAVERALAITAGHPYGTQELCYALWEETPPEARAEADTVGAALQRVLRSENSNFTRLWDNASRTQRLVLQALAGDPADAITAGAYRSKHGLPVASSVQKAVEALVDAEIVTREGPGRYRIAEPFLAEWVSANAV
jgi:uncharacterized protein